VLADRAAIPRRASFAWSPGAVIGALTARKAMRSGVIWGYVFGIAIASSALSYTTIYKTAAERHALAVAYGSNKATSALFGPARQLQTVAGFTAFKISMTLMILGAVWGLLTSTRLLRGEEDAGRWELLLVGQTTRGRAAAQALVGLGGGVAVLWALTAVITVLTGIDASVHLAAGPALYFSVAMVATAVMFVSIGALASELAATRRQAAAYAGAALGVAYAVRMVADAGVGLHGLIWVSPLGWVEELQALVDPQPLALVPIITFTAALASLAIRLAGRRDVGAGVLPDRSRATPRVELLGGPVRLAARLVRPAVTGWWLAIAVTALLYGLIAKSAGSTITGSSIHDVLAKLGSVGTGASAVLGVCFLVLAILLAFMGVGQLAAARAEESSGRLDHVVVRPVARTRWLGGRVLLAVVVLVAGGLLAGVASWLGTASQHAGVGLPSLLAAGVNLVPPALAILGIGVLTYGFRPRATAPVVYGLLGWSALIVIVGGIGATSHWVLDTSVFHQMSPAPAVHPRWEADGVMVAIGLVTTAAGMLAFARRDLQGD
jgi:ABC-2 type transport system permease protein